MRDDETTPRHKGARTGGRLHVDRIVPILDWGRRYDRGALGNDLLAAVIVTVMLIPQSLAYALLAGLPPETGLYASILPLVAYGVFGTSRALAVGPVAVVSLMTAAAIANLELRSPEEIGVAALTLAFLSGAMLTVLGAFRLGFLANFLSHPVVAGFISASGLIIAASQLKHIFGIDASGHSLYSLARSLAENVADTNVVTLGVGACALVFLYWVRKGMKPFLMACGLPERSADLLARAGPVFAVAATTLAAWAFDLEAQGLAIVGSVPQGFPPLTAPSFDLDLWISLVGSALLISVIGFVESVSVAQTLAARKRQRIDPDQELIGLGASNFAASFSGGFPVTGGFARSVVNFDAGAETPAAGLYTAAGITFAALVLTPLLFFLPKATLAATIIVAVLSLVDLAVLKRTWRYSRADFAAVATTLSVTLAFGVEIGVSAGIAVSIALFLYKTSRPHIAEIGRVPETEHFRNIKRHSVVTSPTVLALRVDESLYFANARFLEDFIYNRVVGDEELRHVVLMCSAVNEIDSSALESLEAIDHRLDALGVAFHLSEVKGPVMDQLRRSDFTEHLSGRIFLSQFQAMTELDPAFTTVSRPGAEKVTEASSVARS